MAITKTKRVLSVLLALGIVFSLAACGGSNGSSQNGPASSAATGSAAEPATAEKAFDPMAKYEPAIEFTTVKSNNGQTKFNEGDSMDNNVYYRLYEKDYGIKVRNIWVADDSQYEQKVNITIASNDLPDFFSVSSTQLNNLVKSDSLADLTDIYDKYALPLTKEIIGQDGGVALAASSYSGKLMALPNTGSPYDGAPLLFVRSDWMKKLNLPEPKTMDDVLKISEAFTTQDPDGNNKNDTYGLAISKELYKTGMPDLIGFFNGYHAYPTAWVEDASGNLAYGAIQPETRTALLKLQDLYKSGQIDREFGVKDDTKVQEALNADKCGLFYGVMWVTFGLLPSKEKDPNLDWDCYPLPSVDDQPAMAQLDMPVAQYWVVNKNSRNPEAAVKLLNIFIEKMWGKTADDKVYGSGTSEVSGFKCSAILAWPALKNVEAYRYVTEALKSNDPSKLNNEQKGYYDNILKFNGGDVKQWPFARIFGEESSHAVIDEYYIKNNQTVYNLFYGAPTPTMAEKNATLEKMRDETFTNIILGKPIEEFDKFVENWKKLGGDAITQEVNDWYKTKQ